MYVSEKNRGKISKEYMDKYFCHFYSTEEFQLWSMNNLDKRMKDGWKTYKWVCKDIIYNFNHDAEYRDNKTKVGSLGTVIVGSPSANFINGNYELLEEIVLKDFYNADNDFI
jgi:hypothetical protein